MIEQLREQSPAAAAGPGRLRRIFLAAWSARPVPRRRSVAGLATTVQCAETRLLLSSVSQSLLRAVARGGAESAAAVESGSIATATVTEFAPIAVTSSTGEKPQSKVWVHDDQTWAVLGQRDGLYACQFDGAGWVPKLRLSPQLGIKADVKVVGEVVHVLMQRAAGLTVCSLQYDAEAQSYAFLAGRPLNSPVPAPRDLETATIEVDSTSRMWVAYVAQGRVMVRSSENNGLRWSSAVTLARGLSPDDICAIIARDGHIGVFWSNQYAKRFGYREHEDAASPSKWSADEMPGFQTAPRFGHGLADDHMKLVVNTDGTLYVAAKTSYDSAALPRLILLVRRPNGVWDPVYAIDSAGTRPTVAVRAGTGDLVYAYRETDGAGPIQYRMLFDDGTSIHVGDEHTLIAGSAGADSRVFNDVSTVRTPFEDSVTFIASGSSLLGTAVLTVNSAPA
jgi:hypothetical protein